MRQRRCGPAPVLLGLALIVVAGAIGGCGDAKPDEAVMKIGHVLPDDHPTSQAMAYFKERLKALAGDRIEVRLFPNSQLGSANELIVGCQGGNIEGAVVSAAPLAQYVTALNVLVMPFVFHDNAHQAAVLDGPVGQALRERVAEVGLVAGAYFDAGSRNIMTKKGPIRTPADLAGLKIRVMDSLVLREAVGRLGATAVPMSQGEVYGALQTGVIDGWENNPPTCLTFSMHETGCNHFAWTRHVAIPDLLIISQRWYDGLDADLREAVDRAAHETRDRQRELWREHEARAVQELESAGMQFNEVDADAFAARFAGFYEAYVDKYGEQFGALLAQMKDVSGENGDP